MKTKAPRKIHLAYKEREYFNENLALLLKSAVPIAQALDSLSASTGNKAFKKAIAQMQADIESGYSLADTLERTGIASGQTLALVRLGEESGHLVENLQLAAQQEEKRHVFTSKVRSALIYPGFVISITLVVGIGVAWFLLPRLATTFSQLNVGLPPISRVMINGGLFLQAHGIVAVPAFIIGMIAIIYILFAAPHTKIIGQKIIFHLPGVGRLIREVETAQFGYLLGTLLDVGLPITNAMKLLAAASSSPYYRKLYQSLSVSLEDGYTIQESLTRFKKSQKLLPAPVQQMIIAGERSGSLPDVLATVGRTYEQKSSITTENLETIIEPILLVVVSAGVLLVAIAIILPIYSLVGGLNK